MAYVGNSPTQQSFTGGVDQYNGNNSNTVFGLTRTINTVYDVDVYVENVWQRPTTGYTVSANTITFTSAPPAGSNNVVVVYRNFSATSIVPQQGSVVHTAFAANAIPTALGYVPANKAGDTFSGAVSGITTLAAGNTTITGFANVTTTLAAGNTTITGTLSASANVNFDSGTLFVDGTNNRVGINNTAPTSSLTVTGNAAFSNTVNITGFVDVGNTVRVNSISNPASGSGMELAYDGTQGIIQTYSNRSTLASVPVYFVNGQIKFPATQNASSDANTLDDYEEGTWTPALTFGTSGSVTYTTRAARYVKVGQSVTVSFWLYGATRSSPNGVTTITGFPFPSSSAGQYRPSVFLRTNQVSITGSILGWMPDGQSYLQLEVINNGILTAQFNGTSISGDNFEFGCSFSYITTS